MKISIIIPTYKPQNYIFECLNSLATQTLPKDQWEVIIVLNGCNEPWYSMLIDYLHSHDLPNAQLIQTDKAGVSNARNIGLDDAKGEYITFVDDDDYVSDSYLEKLLEIASPETIAASYTIAYNENTNQAQSYYLEQEYNKWYNNGNSMTFYKPRRYLNGPCMKLIHMSIISNIRFDTRFKNGEDALFCFTISKNMRTIRFTNKAAIYYRRIRTGSATHGYKGWASFKNQTKLILALHSIFWSKPLSYNFILYCTRIMACIRGMLIIK